MFCHLFIFSDNTSIPVYEEKQCFHSCRFFKDDKCSIVEKRNEKLISTSKYGWVLNRVINFGDGFISKNGHTRYLKAILLVHPSSSDVWIVQCEKNLDKHPIIIYRGYVGHSSSELDNIDSVNLWLKKSLLYNGRKLIDEDFNIRR